MLLICGVCVSWGPGGWWCDFIPLLSFLINLGHQLCCVVHDGSDAAVWLTASPQRGNEGPLQRDWLLCKQQHRMVIVAFLNQMGSDLRNNPRMGVQLKNCSRWMKHVCRHVHQELIAIHIQDHPAYSETDEGWTSCSQTSRLLSYAFFWVNDVLMVCADDPKKSKGRIQLQPFTQTLAFFHSLHSHLRVFAFLLNCFCSNELHCYSPSPSSRTLPIPKKRGRVRVRGNLLGGVRWQTTAR